MTLFSGLYPRSNRETLSKEGITMSAKKSYEPPQLFEVALDHEQAILSSCSILTSTVSAGGTTGCRRPTGCSNYPGATPTGCKRSSIPVTYMGQTCHDSGVRAS